MAMPRAFAVLALRISSKVDGCSTGSAEGFSPRCSNPGIL
jgi:hypothetical protein